jgi:fluoride exporter
LRKYLFIGTGGAIGAILRFIIKDFNVQTPGSIPLSTILINVSGCFILGFFLTLAIEVLELGSNTRLGIATGLIGAFTTFSTMCKETVSLIIQGFLFNAVLYAIMSLIFGFAAIFMGIALAREFIITKLER